MTFASPILAALTAMCAAAAVGLLLMRQIRLTHAAKIIGLLGFACLIFAAASPSMLIRGDLRIVIMEDLSDSTRGAAYRDGKTIQALAAEYHAQVVQFPDQPGATETVFSPPDADAIFLFSDGQFEIPRVSPPVYAFIDPNLNAAKDASVANLEYRARELVATLSNSVGEMTVGFSSNPQRPRPIPMGESTIAESLPRNSDPITVRVASNDLWPENNELTIAPSPPSNVERWWVGASPPDDGWRSKTIADLPSEPSKYLLPSVIVLDQTDVAALSPAQMARLHEYANNLGGTLILHDLPRQPSFSPLSDSPPEPMRRWIILCDVSGSMAQTIGNSRRIDLATSAVIKLLPILPANDRVDIGAFARDLSWWKSGKTVADTQGLTFVPPQLSPNGPTNLEAAIAALASSEAAPLPGEVLMITDGEAEIQQAAMLAERLNATKIRLNVLQVGNSVSSSLRSIVQQTNGRQIDASASVDWSQSLQQLAAGGLPNRVVQSLLQIQYANQSFATSSIRQSWLKSGATSIAAADAGTQSFPVVASWMVGAGKVIAITCPQRELAGQIANETAALPHDPRINTSIRSGEDIEIQIDATDSREYLNGLKFTTRIGDESPKPIPQTAPGRYELTIRAPRESTLLTILRDGAVSDRIMLPGRYPREFSHIGINHENLQHLANQTGGKVVDDKTPLNQILPRRIPRDLTILPLISSLLWFASLLILWKQGRFFRS